MSKATPSSTPPLPNSVEPGAAAKPPEGQPAASPRRRSAAEEWVGRLIESDRRMARDPAYRDLVINRKG